MAAAAQGTVHIDPVRLNIQAVYGFIKEN